MIPTLGRKSQEVQKFKAIFGHIKNSRLASAT